jgi:hypothetical protein
MHAPWCSRLVACAAFVVALAWAGGATAVAPPYAQGFEGEATCSVACGAACVLAGGFFNETSDNNDWAVDVGGTPTTNTGPDVDHTLGTAAGKYLYVEASAPCATVMRVARLTSPDLELTGTTLPTAWFWYHMLGADIGTLNVDVVDTAGALIQADVILPLTGDQGASWLQAPDIDLAPFIALGSVRLQIRYTHSGTGQLGDIALDDFVFRDFGDPDVGVASIDAPVIGCGLGMESVTVTLENFSGVPQSGFDVAIAMGALPPIVESYGGTLAPWSTDSFTFATTVDFSLLTPGTLDVATLLAGDVDASNDGASLPIYDVPVAVAPALEDFEGPGATSAWISGGSNNDWALGTPADTTIVGAFSGVASWMTHLTLNYRNNQSSFVATRCGYDFSGVTHPAVRVAIWYEIFTTVGGSTDGAVLQSSVDGGSSWQNVGAVGSGLDWYNDGAIEALPGGFGAGWTGNDGSGSGGWIVASHDLSSLAGQPNVLFRFAFAAGTSLNDDGFAFDDFEIIDVPADGEIALAGEPGETPPAIGAIPEGAVVHVQSLRLTSRAQADSLTTLTVHNAGTAADGAVAWHLYGDDGDGLFDPFLDPLLDSQAQVAGAATLSAGLAVSSIAVTTMHVAAEVLAGAASQDTIISEIAAASDVVFAGPSLPTLDVTPTTGASYSIGERATLPFVDDFSAVDNARRDLFGPGVFPRSPDVMTPPTLGPHYAWQSDVQLLPSHGALFPVAGSGILGFEFPAGPTGAIDSAGAVQYSFDLSALSAASDVLWLFVRYAHDGEEPDFDDGIFVSLDGGASWALMLERFAWTQPPQEWIETTIDVSAALTAATLDYSDNVVIRVQAQDDSPFGFDGAFVDELMLGRPPEMAMERPAGMVIADGGSDVLGNVPAEPTTLVYTIRSVGDFALEIGDPVLSGATGLVSLDALSTGGTIPGGDATTLVVELEPDLGAFSFDVAYTVNDPSLGDATYEIHVQGTGVVPEAEIDVQRPLGTPIASGTGDAQGDVSIGTSVPLTYSVENQGFIDLVVHELTVENAVNVTAGLTSVPSGVVAPGDSASFVVAYTVAAEGAFSFHLVLASNDADEDPYTIVVDGEGTGESGAGGSGAGASGAGASGAGGPGAGGGVGPGPAASGGADCSCRTPGRPRDARVPLFALLLLAGAAAIARWRR